MTTPAPHTPINMVKGGNSLFFSAKCVALLAQCGYSPDDFGTYDQVQKRCATARDKCELYDAQVRARQQAIAGGASESEAPEVTAPEPSDHERFLADCQSGHLAQDASMRNSRDDDDNPGRGNPCANDGRVDGYETRLAPCMPHQGAADEPGTQHHLVSVMENDQPVAHEGLRRNGDYPRQNLDDDCHARTEAALQWRRENAGSWNLAADNGSPNDPPQITDASAAAYFEGTDPKEGAELQGTPKELTGETAADCIESFREAGEAEMKAKCQRDLEKNQATANGGPDRTDEEGRAYREELAQRAADDAEAEAEAHDELVSARRSAGQRHRRMREAYEAYAANPSPENEQRLQDKTNAYWQSQARVSEAQRAHTQAADQASDSRRAHNRARYAQCRYEQGQRLTQGQGSDNPRVPGYNTFVDSGSGAGSASGTGT
ncbi:MAG TPA: hypothetical protein RMH99_29330 [Sandaracinaceae bacterium LLY-WYZ-13_1]|nr:hypothetical protein [Sandaracinaceae bacterium LLY-WYZ-13_1]